VLGFSLYLIHTLLLVDQSLIVIPSMSGSHKRREEPSVLASRGVEQSRHISIRSLLQMLVRRGLDSLLVSRDGEQSYQHGRNTLFAV